MIRPRVAAGTARVITAAAAIMIYVFLAFSLMSQRAIAEFGVSLTVAVALDAFIVRTVLVPPLMHTFGNANWRCLAGSTAACPTSPSSPP